MPERTAMIILAEASPDSPVHCRGWKIPAEDLERIAESLSSGGQPLEWIWDDRDSPGGTRVMIWPDGLQDGTT